MLVIGLTGGIGSGKTTVANIFAQYDIPIIDADKIAHALTQPHTDPFKQIVDHFGPEILHNNHLDRKKLRAIIFSNAKEKQWLERLLHPIIQNAIEAEIKKITSAYCIAVIPLLIEAETYSFIDRILVVDSNKKLQIQRVSLRDHMPAEMIESILNSQVPREHRLTKAHDVIINNGKIEDLYPQVEKLHQKYLGLTK
jgi:dephospho-CoA kinase